MSTMQNSGSMSAPDETESAMKDTDQITAEDEAFENIVTAVLQCQKGTARQFFQSAIEEATEQAWQEHDDVVRALEISNETIKQLGARNQQLRAAHASELRKASPRGEQGASQLARQLRKVLSTTAYTATEWNKAETLCDQLIAALSQPAHASDQNPQCPTCGQRVPDSLLEKIVDAVMQPAHASEPCKSSPASYAASPRGEQGADIAKAIQRLRNEVDIYRAGTDAEEYGLATDIETVCNALSQQGALFWDEKYVDERLGREASWPQIIEAANYSIRAASEQGADTKRLDWLLSDAGRTWLYWRGERKPPRIVNREAIDAALRK